MYCCHNALLFYDLQQPMIVIAHIFSLSWQGAGKAFRSIRDSVGLLNIKKEIAKPMSSNQHHIDKERISSCASPEQNIEKCNLLTLKTGGSQYTRRSGGDFLFGWAGCSSIPHGSWARRYSTLQPCCYDITPILRHCSSNYGHNKDNAEPCSEDHHITYLGNSMLFK